MDFVLKIQGELMSKREIPESWAVTTLGDIAEDFQYGINASASQAGAFKLVRITDIKDEGIHWDSVPNCTVNQNDAQKYLLKHGDILIARSGSIGKFVIIENPPDNAIFASYLIRVKLNPEARKFPMLGAYFASPLFQDHVKTGAQGATQKNVNTETLKRTPFFIPSIMEQKRIISKFESTAQKIKKIETNVSSAHSLTEKYREALLQKAFRGELVPQDPKDEPASKLIERIRAEKEKQSDGKKKKKDDLPPIKPDEIPFEIPKSWDWIRLGELSQAVDYGTSAKTDDDRRGVPVLRMGNIQGGEIEWTSLKYLRKTHDEFPDLFLRPGDLIFNRTNSPELVGKSAVFSGSDVNTSFASYLIRVSFFKNAIVPQYVSWFINSEFGRDWIEKVMVQQVGQANVNGTKLKECIIPVPPYEEQLRICNSISKSLHKRNEVKSMLYALSARLRSLSFSILDNAFDGKLVYQISSEGTGHELLEKIKSSLATDSNLNGKKHKTTSKKTKQVKK